MLTFDEVFNGLRKLFPAYVTEDDYDEHASVRDLMYLIGDRIDDDIQAAKEGE